MQLDHDTLKLMQIFQPKRLEAALEVEEKKKRFVYYTSADTAMQVLRNQELWFRNATAMNDFSEISYGLKLIRAVFFEPVGERFREVVDDIFPETMKRVGESISGWESDWQLESYIACVSVHDPDEDERGRLSMWRAYGDTALVVNNAPMVATTDLLNVFSLPVLYLSKEQLAEHLLEITDSILENKKYLQGLKQDSFANCIQAMFFQFAIASKHPGFKEEQEWRLYYRPTERVSPEMVEEIVVINGVPQKIYKLNLDNKPENGLHGADIASLIDRIIIGPTEFAYVSYKAFVSVLSELNVQDAEKKVILSDIPLRTS